MKLDVGGLGCKPKEPDPRACMLLTTNQPYLRPGMRAETLFVLQAALAWRKGSPPYMFVE